MAIALSAQQQSAATPSALEPEGPLKDISTKLAGKRRRDELEEDALAEEGGGRKILRGPEAEVEVTGGLMAVGEQQTQFSPYFSKDGQPLLSSSQPEVKQEMLFGFNRQQALAFDK